MGKKIGFVAGFGAVWAGLLYLGLRLWLGAGDDAFALQLFYSLLLMTLLLWVGLLGMKKLTGKCGFKQALFLLGCGAVYSFAFLAIALAGAEGLTRQWLSSLTVWTACAYVEMLVMSLFVVHSMRRDAPMATFSPIGTPAGKRAVLVMQVSRVVYYLVLAIPVGLLLNWWLVSDQTWALFALLLWFFITLVGYSYSMDHYANALLLQHIDPAAFYDVQVWLYARHRKRSGQATVLLNLALAYADLDQLPVASQLIDRLKNEPLTPPARTIYYLRRATACQDAALFPALQAEARAALASTKNAALLGQAEILLAGCQASLEHHPQGLLWYADQVEATATLANPRNRVAAALARADAFSLLGETEKARAAYVWAAQNCGGSLLMQREAAEGLAKLAATPAPTPTAEAPCASEPAEAFSVEQSPTPAAPAVDLSAPEQDTADTQP